MDSLTRAAGAWGRLVARRRGWFLAAWLLLTAGLGWFSLQTPELLSPSGFSADTEAARAGDTLRVRFPSRTYPVLYVVLHSDTSPVGDPGFVAEAGAWRDDLTSLVAGKAATVSVTPPGADGRTLAVVVSSDLGPDDFLAAGRSVVRRSHQGPARAYAGGIAVVYATFVRDSERDVASSERISLPVALLLLLVVFGGLVAAGLPVATGAATVTAALAALGLVARAHTVSVFALNVTTAVGLGLGIDYSLLVVNRFREELAAGRDVEEAVGRTAASAGIATAISGGTVLIGFGALMLSRLNVLWSMGLGGLLVVTVSVAASLSLIPALLAVAGRRIDRLALPLPPLGGAGAWQRLALGVMARPWLFIAATLAALLLLALPASGLRPGVVGAESLPPDDPSRTADSLARSQLGFPQHEPILVLAEGVDEAAVGAIHRDLVAIAGTDDVRDATDVPPAELPLFRSGRAAVFEVTQPAPDNDPATLGLLQRLRSQRWPAGVKVSLGGEAPAYDDFVRLVLGDLPRLVGIVLAATLLLLGVSFRSLLLPLKAVAMNLLSVAAALGVLTFIFQQGHLSGLLRFRAVGFTDAILPLIIFAALFGLSMDYEVFLLSRVREEWLGSGDNRRAVAAGMERTGRIITSAALIMVAVLASLAFSSLTVNKALGLSFAAAVLLDATLIRLLLVPALMRVLGDWNWWPVRARASH